MAARQRYGLAIMTGIHSLPYVEKTPWGLSMKQGHRIEEPASWVEKTIRDFINASSDNSLKDGTDKKAWAEPLVGFSSGADPLYVELKKHIGDFYWTPIEVFTKAFPDPSVTPDQLTVISWILPHTETTKRVSREETVYPSESWARARIYGEEGNVRLRRVVVDVLTEAGYHALAPQLDPSWKEETSKVHGDASTWSERHAAFVSGLGTFGLCDGLITAKGKAMRCGSVVTDIKIPPTSRPYEDPHAYCLFYQDGTCGKCITRCPVKAISEAGHDKKKCRDHIFRATGNYVKSHFHFDGYGCGLCQVGVPCESKLPTPCGPR
jgi:hypothetical protein